MPTLSTPDTPAGASNLAGARTAAASAAACSTPAVRKRDVAGLHEPAVARTLAAAARASRSRAARASAAARAGPDSSPAAAARRPGAPAWLADSFSGQH